MLSKPTIWAALLLGIYLIHGLVIIPRSSLTYDEMDHWSYGKRMLKLQPQRIYPTDDASTMPVTGLNAIPRAVEQLANPSLQKTDAGFSDILHGRYLTLLVTLLTGILIWVWSRDLWGERAGLFSLFLFSFCPNLIAHGTLLTTDAYAALATLATAYTGWRYYNAPTWINFGKYCLMLSVAQVVKPSLIHLIPLAGLFALLYLLRNRKQYLAWKKTGLQLVVFIAILLLVINTAFFFSGTGQSFHAYTFRSDLFLFLQKSGWSHWPLPLPVPYVEGIDLTLYLNQLGAGHPDVSGPNYLLGESRRGDGFWYYYLVSFFFKTPLLITGLLLALPILLLRKKVDLPQRHLILALIGIVGYFLLVFGLTNRSQVGIRHVLMVYPLLYVVLGVWFSSASGAASKNRWLWLGMIYLLISFYRFFPNPIPYHQEFLPSKKVYKVMAGSNVDFGQSAFRLERFLKDHLDYRIPDSIPQPGKYIQGVDAYLGLMDRYDFPWLRQFTPVGQFAHGFLLFEVTESELRQKGLR